MQLPRVARGAASIRPSGHGRREPGVRGRPQPFPGGRIVGVFEFPAFAEGTRALAEAVADSGAFSIAGGGDTLAALDRFGITERVSYISTGGGAFLEFLEGKKLPAVAVLEERHGS